MAPKRTRRQKGEILTQAVLNEEGNTTGLSSTLGIHNTDIEIHAKAIIEDIENEVEIRCQKIMHEATTLATSLKNAFSIELVKVPKLIRNMSVKQFCEEHGGDFKAVLKLSVDENLRKQMSAGQGFQSTLTTPAHIRKIAQTPGFTSGTPACPPTALRQPRPGEIVLSSNGSPLAIRENEGRAQVIVKETGKSHIALELQGGQQLDLAASDELTSLPEEVRQTAMSRLKILQEEIHGILSQLEN